MNNTMTSNIYTTKDALKEIGVSRNTLFLWFKQHKIPEVKRDRNGHRIFCREDITSILNYKNQILPPRTN